MKTPDFPFTTDGCSMFPDGNYGGCCKTHDEKYWQGGGWQDRWEADLQLMECVYEKTNSKFLAALMFLGVRIGGMPCLPFPWRWGYGWHYMKACTYSKQLGLNKE